VDRFLMVTSLPVSLLLLLLPIGHRMRSVTGSS
jgi:hypothetical protein